MNKTKVLEKYRTEEINMKELLFFSSTKGVSGLTIGGIKLISRKDFVFDLLVKSRYSDTLMILENKPGERLRNWGKDITEEDLLSIFKGTPIYQREIMLGYHDQLKTSSPWTLRKELHVKYGKNFKTIRELRKNKTSLHEAIITVTEAREKALGGN